MPSAHEIRADFDRDTLAIYQAYSPVIADAALEAGRFVPPFSFHRMTWIKPSFLWLMHRSNWGLKSAQERVLCVRVKRSGWEKALSLACLTSFVPGVFVNPDEWVEQFAVAQVHLQWDPERSLRGAGLQGQAVAPCGAGHAGTGPASADRRVAKSSGLKFFQTLATLSHPPRLSGIVR